MQGTRVSRDREFSWVFVRECNRQAETTTASCEIVCYVGDSANPRWIDTETGMTVHFTCSVLYLTLKDKDKYKTLCTISANVSNVPVFPLKRSSVHFTQAESARPFYRQKFWVVLSFGMTEMKAEVKWFEGVRTNSPFGFIFLAHRRL